jgi:hypothetical protein
MTMTPEERTQLENRRAWLEQELSCWRPGTQPNMERELAAIQARLDSPPPSPTPQPPRAAPSPNPMPQATKPRSPVLIVLLSMLSPVVAVVLALLLVRRLPPSLRGGTFEEWTGGK